jgi:hypothetical protein
MSNNHELLIKNLTDRLDNRTRELKTLQTDFDKLKSDFYHSDRQRIICDNAREQYCRNWSLRFFGINVEQSDINELGLDVACMITVYNRVVKPVLIRADKRILPAVPEWFDLLENGHFVGKALKSKKNPSMYLPKPIIIRFTKRWQRNLFLRLKKDHMPSPTELEKEAGVEKFTATADLTTRNYKFMKLIGDDARVDKVWTLDGQIKFTLVQDLQKQKYVHTVSCILDSVGKILDSAVNALRISRRKAFPSDVQRPTTYVAATTAAPAAPTLTPQGAQEKQPQPQQQQKRTNSSTRAVLLEGPSPAVLEARRQRDLLNEDPDVDFDNQEV